MQIGGVRQHLGTLLGWGSNFSIRASSTGLNPSGSFARASSMAMSRPHRARPGPRLDIASPVILIHPAAGGELLDHRKRAAEASEEIRRINGPAVAADGYRARYSVSISLDEAAVLRGLGGSKTFRSMMTANISFHC